MTRYLISFDGDANDLPDEDLPDAAKAAPELVEQAKDAGVWVFGHPHDVRQGPVPHVVGDLADQRRVGGVPGPAPHPHRDPVAGHSHPDRDLREIVAGVLGLCRRRETPRCSRAVLGGLDEARRVPCGERYVCGWWKQLWSTGAHLRVLLLRTNQRGSATGSWTRSLSRSCSATSPSRIGCSAAASPAASTTTTGRERRPGSTGRSGSRGAAWARIISAHVPVDVRGRILPNYAHIDDDDKIPFWRAVGERVHEHDCKFILQLSHGGRQRDIAGVENAGSRGLSSTGKPDLFHGLPCQAMSHQPRSRPSIQQFAARVPGGPGRRASTASSCTHATATCSRSSSARRSMTGPTSTAGSLENRARFLLEVIDCVRAVVGPGLPSAGQDQRRRSQRRVLPWDKRGNPLADSVAVCQLGGGGGRGRAARLDRELLPASTQSGG